MASSAYKGLTVEFRADTTKLTSALSTLSKESRSLDSTLRQVDRALELDPTNVELLGQKERYASQQADTLQERLDLLNRELASGDVEKGSAAYDALQRDLVRTSTALDKAKSAAKDARRSIEGAGKGARSASSEMDELADGASAASEGMGSAGGAASGLLSTLAESSQTINAVNGLDQLADMAKEAAKAIYEAAKDYDEAGAKIEAACGSATGQAERLKEVGRDLYTNGWGESMSSLSDSLIQAREILGELSEEDLSTVTSGALALEQAFGSDFSETLRGVNVLMGKFGLSATEAMDLITAGTQRGLDYTDELGDNLSEYAGRWGEAGMSASQYFSLLEAGTDAGAYQLDKVGDYLNEFLTSLTDGRMEEAIGSFSEGAQATFEAFKSGGASAQDVLNAVLGELASMPDGYERAQIASALWSSLGEDNAMGMITALANVEDSYTDVAGAAQDAADKVSGSLDNRLETATRKLADAFAPLGEAGVDALGLIADGASVLADGLGEVIGYLPEAAERQETHNDAIRTFSEVASAAKGAAESQAEGIGAIATSADEALASLDELNDSVGDSLGSFYSQSATLDAYVGAIGELSSKSSLTATEQQRLKNAVEGYNKITGDSVEVTDAASGALSKSVDDIDASTDAWKRNAEAQAIQSLAAKYTEQQVEASMQLEVAQSNLAEAEERLDDARRRANDGDLTALADVANYGAEVSRTKNEVLKYQEIIDTTGASIDQLTQRQAELSASLSGPLRDALESLPDEIGGVGVDIAAALSSGVESGAVDAQAAAAFLSDGVRGAFEAMPEGTREVGMQAALLMAEGIAGGQGSVEGATAALNAAASGDLSSLLTYFSEVGIECPADLAAGIEASRDIPTAAASNVAGMTGAALSSAEAAASGSGSRTSANFASGVSSGRGATSAAAGQVSAAASGMGKGDSGQWGRHLASNFADGIRRGIGWVASAASDLLARAKSIMGFSVPREGPWSGAERGGERSGLHLAQNFAGGMRKGIPDVRAAADELMAASAAGTPAASAAVRLPWGASASPALPDVGTAANGLRASSERDRAALAAALSPAASAATPAKIVNLYINDAIVNGDEQIRQAVLGMLQLMQVRGLI